jgi:hypothetical protein
VYLNRKKDQDTMAGNSMGHREQNKDKQCTGSRIKEDRTQECMQQIGRDTS